VISAVVSGTLLGLSCGLAPGPLLTLVLAQALRHGPREGAKVALVPLITDAPIILLALLLASRAASLQPLMGALSIAGGLFVLYLAWDTIRLQDAGNEPQQGRVHSWLKGILTNLLSPNPWLFWMTAGATILAEAMKTGWLAAALFLFVFYVWLVGVKMCIALVAGGSREFLRGRPYRVTMRLLGCMLVVFALLLLHDGLGRFLGT
jgi:threonine/homoserine/homoserine lactone efflux protein